MTSKTASPPGGGSEKRADRRDLSILRQLRLLLTTRRVPRAALLSVSDNARADQAAFELLIDTEIIELSRVRNVDTATLTPEGRLWIAVRGIHTR